MQTIKNEIDETWINGHASAHQNKNFHVFIHRVCTRILCCCCYCHCLFVSSFKCFNFCILSLSIFVLFLIVDTDSSTVGPEQFFVHLIYENEHCILNVRCSSHVNSEQCWTLNTLALFASCRPKIYTTITCFHVCVFQLSTHEEWRAEKERHKQK